jgi:hypothetical protein
VGALRPTIDTQFHIDFSWWDKQNKSIRVFMEEHLCEECRENLRSQPEPRIVDMIDPVTGEVSRLDALWEAIRACCSSRQDYITADTPLLDSIFRLFLANGNQPLSAQELYLKLNKNPPETILRVLTKGTVHLGIRPA